VYPTVPQAFVSACSKQQIHWCTVVEGGLKAPGQETPSSSTVSAGTSCSSSRISPAAASAFSPLPVRPGCCLGEDAAPEPQVKLFCLPLFARCCRTATKEAPARRSYRCSGFGRYRCLGSASRGCGWNRAGLKQEQTVVTTLSQPPKLNLKGDSCLVVRTSRSKVSAPLDKQALLVILFLKQELFDSTEEKKR